MLQALAYMLVRRPNTLAGKKEKTLLRVNFFSVLFRWSLSVRFFQLADKIFLSVYTTRINVPLVTCEPQKDITWYSRCFGLVLWKREFRRLTNLEAQVVVYTDSASVAKSLTKSYEHNQLIIAIQESTQHKSYSHLDSSWSRNRRKW